ncbi:CpsD/CapB family tyrosine-protein kinase [Devosia geojensis]|uniref:CpsD/CapB family tyrosine-protein kinase n=1 Tax=Devosia geojensis TaxID=443610 RepID=UPI000696C72F|nr:CpsD/CapB family tyrosine-protein kinase [Devosia geojensis]
MKNTRIDLMTFDPGPADILAPPHLSDAPAGEIEGDAVWQGLHLMAPKQSIGRDHRIVLDAKRAPSPAWDELRTRTALTMAQNHWSVLGITSPTPGCGRTTVALNLALGLSRQNNCRVVLLDFDLRKAGMAALLQVDRSLPFADFLSGATKVQQSFIRVSNSLAIGCNTRPESRASELLLDAGVQLALADVRRQLKPDIMILDLAAMIGSDGVLACLPLVDCMMLVAEAEKTSFGEIDVCERELSERSNLLGIVLNKCRHGPARYGF